MVLPCSPGNPVCSNHLVLLTPRELYDRWVESYRDKEWRGALPQLRDSLVQEYGYEGALRVCRAVHDAGEDLILPNIAPHLGIEDWDDIVLKLAWRVFLAQTFEETTRGDLPTAFDHHWAFAKWKNAGLSDEDAWTVASLDPEWEPAT